jgi:signal transduction histidine kinase
MRTSITFRLLLLTNLLVLATVLAVAALAGQVAGEVVQDRLVRDTAVQTSRFLQASRLPLSDRLMNDLRQIFGSHFAAAGGEHESILGSSLPATLRGELSRVLHPADEIYEVRVGDTDYLVGSGPVRRDGNDGGPGEAARFYVLMPSEDLEQAGRIARRRTLLAAAPAVFVATLLGIGLSLTIIRPIRRLAKEMDRIAASQGEGEASAAADDPPARRGPTEVARLATSFDRLLARLADVQDELIRSQRLAALGKVAASAAHELRNPLSGIRMHLRLMQDEADGKGTGEQDDLDVLVREVERMDLYLQELTDLAAGGSAATASRPVPSESLERTDLAATVSSVLRLLEGRCRHGGVRVQCDYHTEAPQALCLPNRLRQVLMNLVINAIEAMPGGGELAIRTSSAGRRRVRLSVEDSGSGIQAEPPEQVFALFFSSKEHSSGLGLYIARQLVLSQGGEIGCENIERGARFWIELQAASEEAE